MSDEQFIVHGPKADYDKPTQPLGTILLKTMQGFGEQIMHINALDGSSETFASCRSRSIRIAQHMRSHGIGKGDNISICSRNQMDAFATAVAASFIGAPINGLDVGLAASDFKHILNLIKPKAVFCEMEGLPAITEALSEIALSTLIVVYDEQGRKHVSFSEFLVSREDEESFKPVDFENLKQAPLFIVCSSGTSGYPKAVMISHFTVVAMLGNTFRDQQAAFGMSNVASRMFVFTSLYWLSGLANLFMCLYTGVTKIFIPKPFSEKLALDIFQKYKPTFLILPPSMVNRLVKYPDIKNYDLSSISALTVAGSKASPEMCAQMNELLPRGVVINAYGLTECPAGIAMNLPSKNINFNATGKLVKGLSAKIVDVGTKKLLGRNKEGELWVKTDFLMQGYYNNPEETAKAIDKDGWLHTGDMGYFDEDDIFFITDRVKEVLKYQNWPISPAEVENELLQHPAVADCGIVGVPHDVYGDLLVAFVHLVEGTHATEELLKEFVADRVSDAKRLRGGVVFLTKLPVLPSGKVNRKQLKAKALEMREELLRKAD